MTTESIVYGGIQGPEGPAGSGNNTVSNVAPTNPTLGDFWFNPATNVLQIYNGSGWTVQLIDEGYF